MANRKSKLRPTKDRPTPISDERRKLFASINEALEVYRKATKADDVDIVGVMFFKCITSVLRREFFTEDYENICESWGLLKEHSAKVLNDMKETTRIIRELNRQHKA